jgi:hypothetical protein
MMNFKFLQFLFAAILLMGICHGCAVEHDQVQNRPPLIKKGLSTFESQFGTLKPETFSFFFWPQGLSEVQTEALAKKVNSLSMQIDSLTISLHDMVEQKTSLEGDFASLKCILKWANLGPGDDPDLIVWVTDWKTSADATELAAIQVCQNNQDTRKDLVSKIDHNTSVDQPLLIVQIYKALDPGYPDTVENSKTINAPDSKIAIIAPPEIAKGATKSAPSTSNVNTAVVKISLKDFVLKGYSPATDSKGVEHITNANYNLDTNLLTFDVPEVDSAKNPTGMTYRFALERVPNIAGYARFKGDVFLLNGEKKTRVGSAKIDAKMSAN